jgi:three-Cys-motif partner protein
MRKMLVSIFNDVDSQNTRSLESAIDNLPELEKLKYKPAVWNQEVGEKIVREFEEGSIVPTLSFVDPWGYKGLSLRLINSVLKDWGCDCIFFFNYNRINAGLHNTAVKKHIDALFGEERAQRLRRELKAEPYSPEAREKRIITALQEALCEMGGKYVLPFRFMNDAGTRTSHYLVFVTKHPKGYGIMKGIMAKASTGGQQGVPTFEYNPAPPDEQLNLELTGPLDELGRMLLDKFAGQTLTMIEIYDRHNINTPFIAPNYRDALGNLEEQGKIKVDPPASMRQKRGGKPTFGPTVLVTFPMKAKNR